MCIHKNDTSTGRISEIFYEKHLWCAHLKLFSVMMLRKEEQQAHGNLNLGHIRTSWEVVITMV